MMTRIRSTAALLTLIAALLSFTESVWASTCAPQAPADPATLAAAPDIHEGGHHHGSAPAAPAGDDEPQGCPMGAVMVTCTAAALLPASVVVTGIADLAPAPLFAAPAEPEPRTWATTLFRPPRN